MTLGTTLRRFRLNAGLSQGELASRAGLNQSMISRIERGEFENITLDTLRGLAHALSCSPVDFLPEEDRRPKCTPMTAVEALELRVKALEARLEQAAGGRE